jgi:hypothetical protein
MDQIDTVNIQRIGSYVKDDVCKARSIIPVDIRTIYL